MDGKATRKWFVACHPFLTICLLFMLTACNQTSVAAPEPVMITIAGATGMHPVLHALTDAFTKQNPHVLFDLRSGGNRLGGEQLQGGQTDLAASVLLFQTQDVPDNKANKGASAEADSGELAMDEAETAPLLHIPIGIDGLVIITHPSNNIRNISSSQLQKLYNGTIWDWAEVGSNRGEVLLVSREDGSGARTLFEEWIMDNGEVSLTAVVMPTSADVLAYVARHPDAIGYLSRATVPALISPTAGQEANQESSIDEPMRPQVRVLSLDRIHPTAENLESQSYAFSHTLYLVSRGEPQGWVRQFINFTLSPAGQELVGQYHAKIQ